MAQADQALEQAFQDKLEATTARRGWAEELAKHSDSETETRLKVQQEELERASQHASRALAQAQRKKLEIESKLRSAEAQAERRRAEAEVACEQLRKRAEALLKDEETRLQDQYAIAAAKLNELKQARVQTEERLRKERARIDSELNASQQTLQLQAQEIKEELERHKLAAGRKVEQIRSKEANEEDRLRNGTEVALMGERQKLEAQFALSVAELEKSEVSLVKAEQAKYTADLEAKRIVSALQAAEDKRREESIAARVATNETLALEAEQAGMSVLEAQQAKQNAEEKRRIAMQKLAKVRAASGEDVEPRELDDENNLRQEIELIDANVSAAIGTLELAELAKDSAEANRIAAEEKAAKLTESEQELRLSLHQEAEAWLNQERQRSQAELDKAEQELAQKWALREANEEQRKNLDSSGGDLLQDISAQLSGAHDALEAVGKKAYAEEKTDLAVAAQEDLAAKKIKTQAALDAARAQIARLRRQGLLD